MLNPNPVSRKQMQNLDLFFIQISLFINFIRTNFIKMSLCCFTNFLLWNCGLRNAQTNCLKFPPDTCPSASAILNPMNLAPGLVSWFHESGFGFRKSGLNKRNGFWNRFQIWSNQTGPQCLTSYVYYVLVMTSQSIAKCIMGPGNCDANTCYITFMCSRYNYLTREIRF